jgi:hypothetical protein
MSTLSSFSFFILCLPCKKKRDVHFKAGEFDNFEKGSAEIAKAKVELLAWYQKVPNLAQDVTSLAWQHREHVPLLRVNSGVNVGLAQIQIIPRSGWEKMG